MKKDRARAENSCNSAEKPPRKNPAENLPVFLVLAILLIAAAIFSSHKTFFRKNPTPAPGDGAEKYVWLTGFPETPDGLYLFSREQLAHDFPAIGRFLAEQAAPGIDLPVRAIRYDDGILQLDLLPPSVANIFLQPIPINRADKSILTSLPGIGPVLAERIVQRRERHGPFRSKDELLQITGIGPKKFAGLVDHISLE